MSLNTPAQKYRSSGIELFRILTMLIIVAHHYVVNSGLRQLILSETALTPNSIFLLLFGWGGKTGINCFVLITGYFMVESKITLKKFLKLLLWAEFYKVLFYFIFVATGYTAFSFGSMLKAITPISSVTNNFFGNYIIFYLFIPFLNILIKNISKKEHIMLILLCLFVFTVLPTIGVNVSYNYVMWYFVIYLIGSYLRIYPEKWFDNNRVWGWLTIITVILSWLSVILIAYITLKVKGKICYEYHFISDCNKPLALMTAIAAFMYFKNLNIGYNRIINTIAASAFGVLLIHANSDTMRKFIWSDLFDNVGYYNSKFVVIHAVTTIILIYVVCTIIDILRIKFIETPFFKYFDKRM